ncbi:MOSC domain-containing protein [Paenirhodobacter sp.]|uniref:MOSC domain-containing protein n=1 Tax=Paenirhodobacter sp. TaxID=1965326 RepID=UPI003B3E534C
MATLAHIFRHPIKSIGYEEIRTAFLEEGRVLPFDRLWAVATEQAKFDGPLTGWASKMNFVRGAAAPGLMAVAARTHDDGTIELTHPELWHLRIDLDDPADQVKLMEWLRPLWAGRPAPRSVERPGVALTDQREARISILSLSSLADFGARTGVPMSPHRFRGNLWVAGWAPWAERDLTGRRLRIGPAQVEIVAPIGRCRATHANPETGVEDLDTLAALRAAHGDQDFGLFGVVTRPGEIARDDVVEIL